MHINSHLSVHTSKTKKLLNDVQKGRKQQEKKFKYEVCCDSGLPVIQRAWKPQTRERVGSSNDQNGVRRAVIRVELSLKAMAFSLRYVADQLFSEVRFAKEQHGHGKCCCTTSF